MATYYGVVKSNVVVLPDNVALADGTKVEVRVPDDVVQEEDERRRETLFKQELLKAGLLAEIKTPMHSPELSERTLIEVRGKPLSETIIEEP